MDFSDGCVKLAESSWKLNIGYPLVFTYRYGELEDVDLPDEVKDSEGLEKFIRKLAEDDTFDAIAIISEVWFDIVTFGKPLKLSVKHPGAKDGLAITLIGRERSYVALAQVVNGEIGPFSHWRILSGGRFSGIRISRKLEKAV